MKALFAKINTAARANPLLCTASVSFVIAEAVLAVLIQLTEYELYEALAYTSVALAAAFCLLSALWFPRGWLVRAGLGITLIADYFLILSEPVQELVGVIFFSAVQLCYFLAIFKTEDTARRRIHLAVRIVTVCAVMAIGGAILGTGTDALALWSSFYYANLLVNAVFSLTERGLRALGVGLVLFALCDATLGLAFLGESYLNLTSGPLYALNHTNLNIPWLFYVPSQTVIALSVSARERK